ncbi:HAD family phosphatase [Olsenella uli]|uniref:HAD family hydrolase n=1 Tax=Olsenella uli TaxID=133926 RepID=UPI00195A26D1|nr:HAD family hydrolase [Olsenella uli]MBM6675592.1 HAD family phosphatase [Olsenella uli]
MIRLVLSDLDATLIWRDDHVITPFALEAIRALRAAGVHFAPCTGRIYRDLPHMFAGDEQACSTAVTSNGQLVYLDGELVERVAIDHGELVGVAGELSGIADAYLVVEYGGEKVAVGAELSFVVAHPDNFWRVETAVPEVPEEPCYKANVRVVGSFERCQEVAALLAARRPALDFVCPMPGTPHIDITPHGFGKDHGGDFLMERLGLAPEEVCCFGDAENDLAVLRHYENSVAVANAVPAVRECARYHIGPADRDSVARAFLDIAEATAAGRLPSFMCDNRGPNYVPRSTRHGGDEA